MLRGVRRLGGDRKGTWNARECRQQMQRACSTTVRLGDPWKVPGGARRADDRSERGSGRAPGAGPEGGAAGEWFAGPRRACAVQGRWSVGGLRLVW